MNPDTMTPAEYSRWASAWQEYADVREATRVMDPATLTGYISTLHDIRALPEVER